MSNLTSKRWEEVERIMIDGNSILKSMYEEYCISAEKKASYSEYRAKVISMGVYSEKVSKVTQIEEEVVLGCQNLAAKFANKWQASKEYDDLVSEANIAILDAVRAFSKEGVKFITYVHHAISNRMQKFAGDVRKVAKLKRLYEEAKLKLENESARKYAFNEVCEELKLSEKDYRLLESGMHGVVGQGEDQLEIEDTRIDICDKIHASSVFEDIMENVELDDWERTVLDAYLSSTSSKEKSGWQTDVAKNTINPITNKPYSRAAPRIAMERIKEKIVEYQTSKVA